MKCKRCNKEMRVRVGKYVTIYSCPSNKHSNFYLWDEMFKNQNINK